MAKKQEKMPMTKKEMDKEHGKSHERIEKRGGKKCK